MLGPENLFTKNRWMNRARLWRLIFLMHPAGYWEPSPALAFSLLAQKITKEDVKRFKAKKKAAARESAVVVDGQPAGDDAGKDVADERFLCPLTGLDPEALEWSLPARLKAVAALYEDSERPMPVVRIWVSGRACLAPTGAAAGIALLFFGDCFCLPPAAAAA